MVAICIFPCLILCRFQQNEVTMKSTFAYLLLIFGCMGHSISAWAVRPFITDDARVVGFRLAQWESWLRLDAHAQQQWHMFAYGPNRKLELTGGMVMGFDRSRPELGREFSYALPLLQGKYLFRPYADKEVPGVALVAGTFLPGGRGAFVPPGYGAFSFLIVSQCFGEKEDVLVHLNVGQNYLFMNQQNVWLTTWGLGAQARAYKGFHLVGEVFSGDPYIPGTGLAYQIGFRHFFSDFVQIDATIGEGLRGDIALPFWGSVGIRVVTTAFQRKRHP